jgi:general secretion pathway protein L
MRRIESPQFSAVDLRLSSQLGLRRIINLPLAAKSNLADLLYYEIDRLSPFHADAIYFSWRVIETAPVKQRIKVEVVCIPKKTIDLVLSVAKAHRLSIGRIELEGLQELDFLHRVQPDTTRSRLQVGLRYVAALACLVLLAIGTFTTQRQQKDIERLDNEIASARSQANEHSAARKQYEQLAETIRLVENRRADTPTVTEILAELTQIVPDQAFLVQLVIHHDTVQLFGFAERASALITLLEQSPMFAAPRFDSPVTMNSDTGREQFHLTVQTVTSLN